MQNCSGIVIFCRALQCAKYFSPTPSSLVWLAVIVGGGLLGLPWCV